MSMGRPRTKDFLLPPRMHRKGNAFYYVAGNKWTALGSDLAMAKVKWAVLEGNSSGTFQSIADLYIAKGMGKLADSTKNNYRRMAVNICHVFGKMRLQDIKPHHIATYLDEHPARQLVNAHVSLMSNMFRLAMRRGMIDINPCDGVEKNATNVREVFLTDDEYQKVRDNVADWIQCAMDIAMLTGCRKVDTVKIMLSDITDDGLLIVQKKTGHKQLFTWTPELLRVINTAKSLPRPIKSFYLLGSKNGKPYSERSIDNAFRRAKNKLGLGDRQFRDIRAKSGTEAEEQGQDYQALLGHSTKAMSDRYIKNRKAKKVQPLNKILEGSKTNAR